MKYSIIAFCLLFTIQLSARKVWTLQECIETALTHNRNMKLQNLSTEEAQIYLEQARLNLLPSINAMANQSLLSGYFPSETNLKEKGKTNRISFGISGNLSLFEGLKNKYTIDKQKMELQASQVDLEKLRFEISIQVSNAFLQVLLNKELLQIALDQLALTSAKIDQQRLLIENGKLTEGELYEFLAQQAKEEMTKTQAENDLKLSLLNLAQLMEIDDFESIEVTADDQLIKNDLSLQSPDILYQKSINKRPEIKGAELRLTSSEKSISITRSSFFPSLSMNADLSSDINSQNKDTYNNQLSENKYFSIGLRLQIPIFNRFDTRNRVSLAKIQVQGKHIEVENAKLELQKTIRQAYYNAVAARSRWEAAKKSQQAAQEAFRYANQRYEVGKITSYEMYQSKNNLTLVLSEEAQAKYSFLFSTKILEYYHYE